MDFGPYIGVGYVGRERGGGIGGRDLNNRSNTLKTLNTCNEIIRLVKNKEL
jgi:hypothetical protein